MNLDASTLWVAHGGRRRGDRALTGTFYPLMLAIGLIAGAVAAHAGPGHHRDPGERRWRQHGVGRLLAQKPPGRTSARAECSVNLDVGETIYIDAWQADGTAIVKYAAARAGPPHPPPRHHCPLPACTAWLSCGQTPAGRSAVARASPSCPLLHRSCPLPAAKNLMKSPSSFFRHRRDLHRARRQDRARSTPG